MQNMMYLSGNFYPQIHPKSSLRLKTNNYYLLYIVYGTMFVFFSGNDILSAKGIPRNGHVTPEEEVNKQFTV